MKHRRRHFALTLALVALLAFAVAACGDDESTSGSSSPSPTVSTTTVAPMPTITTTGGLTDALKAGNYSEALKSLAAIGLDKQLDKLTDWTVFIPNDDAFSALPVGTIATLTKDGQIKAVLQYHVVEGQQISVTGTTSGTTYTTLQGEDITLGMSGSTYTVNGAPIVKAVQTTNGMIYEIGAVLLPPSIAGTPSPSPSGSATP